METQEKRLGKIWDALSTWQKFRERSLSSLETEKEDEEREKMEECRKGAKQQLFFC